MLVAPGRGAAREIYAKLKPVLELDAMAVFVPSGGEPSLILEWASGISETALSPTTLGALVAEIERGAERSLVLESLQQNADPRAAPFRDLKLASVAVGALAVEGRLLGAVVLGTRAKEQGRWSGPAGVCG